MHTSYQRRREMSLSLKDFAAADVFLTILGTPVNSVRGSRFSAILLRMVSCAILIGLMIGGGYSQSTPASQSDNQVPDARGTSSKGLQRAPTPVSTSSRDIECQRRHADWERNRTPWSFFWGFLFYLVINLFLTFISFKNTTVRVITSIVLAALMGPSLLALQMQDALKVCPTPPGFLGSLSAAIFVWTLVGSLSTWLIVCLIRYLIVIPQFRKQHSV